jgi:phosphinothricin acetyltransferase
MIRNVTLHDAKQICNIYNHYIINTTITFEEEPIAEKEILHRIKSFSAKLPWLVYEQDGNVIGYAYASDWRSRIAYRYSVETTVYLKAGTEGQGIGSLLYKALIEKINLLPIHTLIGGISLPNDTSVALHEKLGFKKVAHFEEVGFKLNRWIDVGYWQLLLKSAI